VPRDFTPERRQLTRGRVAQYPIEDFQTVIADYGNLAVQKRRALFDAMNIKGGKAADQVFDGIGQLWALDFLDGHQLDPDVLRDTARRYAHLYWNRNGATAPKIGKAERVGFHCRALRTPDRI
jgi:hypothetical protein